MWGPEGFTGLMTEPYAESPAGERQVQYFDKSRMEITNPNADSSADWYVTNGLLVVELITGRMQVGDNSFEQRAPAEVNVAGDADDPTGPTYASFQVAMDIPARGEGAYVMERIDRDGFVSEDSSLIARNVIAEHYVAETEHTVAGPFWAFMNSTGLVYRNGENITDTFFPSPFYATGLPITEAYWANVKVAGVYQDVLVQCFERRCLTYTPGNDAGWQVEAGNVGQHYYAWRYSQEPGDQPTPTPDPSPTPEPTPEPPVVDYTYTGAWDTQVHGSPAYNGPVGIAVDSASGWVFVAESGEHDIQRLSLDGTSLGGWGTMGAANDQLDRPEGLATDLYGVVYAADYNNDRVQMFFPYDGGYFGTVANAASQGLDGPMDVAVRVTPGSTPDDPIFEVFIVDHLNHRIQKRTATSFNKLTPDRSDVQPLLTIGGQGSANGQLYFPNGIGIDAAGNIYVADTANHRVQKFSPDGEWIVSLGSFGTGPGEFIYPRDVAVSPDGRRIYVVNSGDQNGGASIKVWELLKGDSDYIFDFEWGVTGSEPGQFNYPARIAIDQDGNVYVTELLNNRVQKFTAEGELLDVWTDASHGAFGRPVEIEDGDDGNLYVVDDELKQVKVFSASGEYVRQWSDQLQNPVDVAVRDGYAYVADQTLNMILKFTSAGEFVKSWGGPGAGEGQFGKPEGVAVDDDGYVYVVDNGNYRIQKFTPEGEFVTAWGSYGTGPGQFENSKGIAIHGDALYVVDFFPARVQQFELDGNYVREFGGEGEAPGQLSGAYAVSVDADGYVYVADRDNHRIQKFTAEGEYLAMLTPETTMTPESLVMPNFSAPVGLAVSAEGTIYAVSGLLEGIMIFQPGVAPAP
jgi:DNA-binding beta-propeller fold protein YncE